MRYPSPRSQERDNQNTLRKFPFADDAECGNRACTIPHGAIVDAQLYVPSGEPSRVWLSSVRDGVLTFSDSRGEIARTTGPLTAGAAVPVRFGFGGTERPGGVVVLGDAGQVAALAALSGQEFTADQAELSPAAVAFVGLPGVLGFRLDDGNVVSGHVRFRGENGMLVETFVGGDGRGRLRLSAIGTPPETGDAQFIRRVVADSDNVNFTVGPDPLAHHVVDVLAAGVMMTADDGNPAGQDDICGAVRKTVGSVPSGRGAADGSCDPCENPGDRATHTITFVSNGVTVNRITLLEGSPLGSVPVPDGVPPNDRFTGYFTAPFGDGKPGKRYYRQDGTGVGTFSSQEDVTVYAGWIAGSSRTEVTFVGYGTLHLSAPSTPTYENPLRISGVQNPPAATRRTGTDDLAKKGPSALTDMILGGNAPAGEVNLGIRGLSKATST